MNDPSEPLKNARHERFACEVAKGASQEEAYRLAGYSPDRGAACRLSAKISVQARIAWLKKQAANADVLTIAEKRQFLARLLRVNAHTMDLDKDGDLLAGFQVDKDGMPVVRLADKIKAIQVDNDLAGEGAEAGANKALEIIIKRL